MKEESILTETMKKSRLVIKFFDRIFIKNKCPMYATQYELLRLINECNEDTITEFSESIGMDRTTLTKRIKNLVQDKYVEYVKTINLKNKRFRATQKGKFLLEKYEKLYNETNQQCKEAIK